MALYKHLSILIFVLFCMGKLSNAQGCDCISNFNWVRETFEANDAGFAFVVNAKGEETYKRLNEETLQQLKGVDDLEECLGIINNWLLFFRKGHIGVQQLEEDKEPRLSKKKIRAKYKDWEKVNRNLKELEKELLAKEKDGFEGVWESGIYKIGIVKEKEAYRGVILKADGAYWMPGQVKLKINASNGKAQGIFYMYDHSEEKVDAISLLDANHLLMGDIDLTRAKPKVASDPAVLNYFKAMEADMPYLEPLDEETFYLRIPSFNIGYKEIIDKLILDNKEKILQKPYLIIDIRNNGGGSDDSYDEILPLLYTQPIKVVGAEFLSTPLNNSSIYKLIKNPKLDEETRDFLQETYDKLEKNVGSFVNLEDEEETFIEMEEVHPYPQKVGILINEKNASSAEEFILAAQQSSKVQLFGRSTSGILDISNVNILTSPCEDFVLAYSLSKSFRIPEEAIDGSGIAPEVPIPANVPNHKWVDFARKMLVDK